MLVPLLVRFAIGRKLLDVSNTRSSYEVSTPRLGGLVVISGVWCAGLLLPLALLGAEWGAGSAVVAAAMGGFLVWNLSPARIFLGDLGAYFVGFFLAVLYTQPVAGSPYLAFVVAAAVFTPYLFDTGFTLVRRAWARKNVFSAHREHLYQCITPDPAPAGQQRLLRTRRRLHRRRVLCRPDAPTAFRGRRPFLSPLRVGTSGTL